MYCIMRNYFHKCFKIRTRIKYKHLIIGVCIIILLDIFGAFTHVFELPYDDSFAYPYEGDIHEFISALRNNQKPSVPPINEYNYSCIHDIKEKCINFGSKSLRIVFLVKSAVENFDRRIAIRNSWGFEKRFSDVPFRTVFLLGTHPNDHTTMNRINSEHATYKDIVQADFLDAYYNNTIKTMLGFKWIIHTCLNSKFYMFVDDDMYVSVKNVLRFIRDPALYPDYLRDSLKFKNVQSISKRSKRATAKEKILLRKQPGWKNHTKTIYPIVEARNQSKTSLRLRRQKRQVFDFQLSEDVRLFAGFVIISAPHRHRTSKWYISLKEYPYHLWPPYVTAGAYILSKEALLDMYYASMYTKHFRFDDIFLGLVAKKADIEPFHCEEFHFYKKDYTRHNYKYVITSHGYGNPEELLRVWHEQKSTGNA